MLRCLGSETYTILVHCVNENLIANVSPIIHGNPISSCVLNGPLKPLRVVLAKFRKKGLSKPIKLPFSLFEPFQAVLSKI